MRTTVLGALLALAGATSWAADLGSEITTWGPLVTGDTPIEDGQWFGQAFALGTAGDRLDGLFVVARDPGVDVQLAGGFAYDRAKKADRDQFFESYDWGRAYVRGGTDPLADEAGRPFGAVGGALCLPLWLSLQAEVGYSSQRKLLLNGEASLFVLRVRFDHDETIDTVRLGTGPRILGTTGPLAWGGLIDWSRSRYQDAGTELFADGRIVTAFAIWRPWNHLLLALESQVVNGVMKPDDQVGTSRVRAEFSLAVGTVF